MHRNWRITILLVIAALIIGGAGFYLTVIQSKDLRSEISRLKSSLNDSKKEIATTKAELLEFSNNNEKVVIYGDSRTGTQEHKKIISLITKRQPEAVFNVGDIVEEGSKPDEWPVFNEITKDIRSNANYYVALGNHEQDSPNFYNNFELPGNEQWYSVNFNKIHFTVLDSNKDLGLGSQQYKWFENDLANVGKDIKFKVVVLHHPPYSTGKHEEDELGLRKTIVPLIEKYKVNVVFTGHDHHYERSEVNGIAYFVVGGGGAPLYPQARKSEASKVFAPVYHFSVLERKKDELKINVYDIEDKVIDELKIK